MRDEVVNMIKTSRNFYCLYNNEESVNLTFSQFSANDRNFLAA